MSERAGKELWRKVSVYERNYVLLRLMDIAEHLEALGNGATNQECRRAVACRTAVRLLSDESPAIEVRG